MAVVIAYNMLKSALGLTAFSVCILLATCASYPSEEDEVTLASLFKKCRSATGASKTAYDAFKVLKVPASREGRCFVKCVVDRSDQLPRKGRRVVKKYLRKTKFNRYFSKLRCPDIDESGGGGGSYDSHGDYDDAYDGGRGGGRASLNSDYGDDHYADDDYTELRAKKKQSKAGSPAGPSGKSGKAKANARSPK